MAASIARLKGTMLIPGVSRNGRGYSRDLLARAYDRLVDRIERSAIPGSGIDPVTVYTSHQKAGEDATREQVGIVDKVSLDEQDGRIRYEAAIAGNEAGRDVLPLIDTSDGQRPFTRGVSIRGAWLGDITRTELDGVPCEAGPDLDIFGLDLTSTPGVPGAEIEDVTRTPAGRAPRETADRRLIFESAPEATVTITETAPESSAPTAWAAPGHYHPDGKPRHPLDSRAQAVETFRALATEAVARDYTAAQLLRCRQRAVRALSRHGVAVTAEGWLRTAGPGSGEVAEGWDPVTDRSDGGFCVSLNCGPFSVSVQSYDVDPHDLDRLSRAAASAAADALSAIKDAPDADVVAEPEWAGEGGKPAFLTDDDSGEDEDGPDDEDPAESGSSSTTTEAADVVADPPKETIMAENATPAVEATPAPEAAPQAVTLSQEQFAQLLATTQAQPAPAVEAAPPVPSAEDRIRALEAELAAAKAAQPAVEQAPAVPAPVVDMAAIMQAAQEAAAVAAVQAVQADAQANGVQRVGLTAQPGNTLGTPAAESITDLGIPSSWPQKPLHTYTTQERAKYLAAHTERVVMGARSAALRG